MELPQQLDAGPLFLEGGAGPLEVFIDLPRSPPRAVALIAHPHPLQGGSAAHKIPVLLAKALCDVGLICARPNFRGVGRSAGSHDEGRGETDDHVVLAKALHQRFSEHPLVLVGFSFGAFVSAWSFDALRADVPVAAVCLAGMPSGPVSAGRTYDLPSTLPDALVIHGEQDERVPLPALFDWARPHFHPILVVPGADHFFTGRLPVLRTAILQHVNLALTN